MRSTLGADDGTVLTKGRSRPYPVICDLCMPEVDESEHEAREAELD